jgi:hypothetical protein
MVNFWVGKFWAAARVLRFDCWNATIRCFAEMQFRAGANFSGGGSWPVLDAGGSLLALQSPVSGKQRRGNSLPTQHLLQPLASNTETDRGHAYSTDGFSPLFIAFVAVHCNVYIIAAASLVQ